MISRTESPEPNADERPTEEGRKGSEAVRAPRTGGREPGRRGGSPAKQSPRVCLAKAEGPDRLCSHSKRDLASGRSQVNSSAVVRVVNNWYLVSQGREHQNKLLIHLIV